MTQISTYDQTERFPPLAQHAEMVSFGECDDTLRAQGLRMIMRQNRHDACKAEFFRYGLSDVTVISVSHPPCVVEKIEDGAVSHSDDYTLVFCDSGKETFVVGDTKADLIPGTAVLVNWSDVNRFESSIPLTKFQVIFPKRLSEALLGCEVKVPNQFHCSATEFEALSSFAHNVARLTNSDAEEKEQLEAVLIDLISKTIRPESVEPFSAVPHLTLELIQNAVRQNISNPDLTIEWASKILGHPQSELRRVLNDANTTLRKTVLPLRLEKGRDYLRNSSPSVSTKQIAIAAGFRSTASFSVAYKRYFGISPSQERQWMILSS